MKYLALLIFFLPLAFDGTSQVITEAEMNELLNSDEIQLQNPVISNFLSIQQISDDNSIISIQNNPGVASNKVMITQDGNGNNGYINQNGSGNDTRLWQYNSSNEASLWSEGNNITTLVKQEGDGNVINSYIKNLDLQSRSALLLQEGNNNRIDLAIYGDEAPAAGLTSQEFKIKQQGNNHAVEAFMENDFRSMEINQNSGIDGDVMQIKVTQSDFYFPGK